MHVQPLQQSFSSRHKLAALLALITPGLALADDARKRQTTSLAIEEVDGWVPRVGRSTLISPLVVLPTTQQPEHLAPVPRLPNGPPIGAQHLDDGLTAQWLQANESAMKIGQSGSSTLKIVPNVLAPEPGSVELQCETPLELVSETHSTEPMQRIARAEKAKSAIVDNPEQNEPKSDEIGTADSFVGDESDGVVPDVSDVDMAAEETTASEPQPDADASAGDDASANAGPMEIRKLRLRDDLPGSDDPVSLKPLDPSIAKMRVGDVEPLPPNEQKSRGPVESVQPPRRSATSSVDKPIQGDSITRAGELILASGQNAANLTVTHQTARLKPMIEQTLKYYWDRPEDAAQRTHWGMMHSIMVFDRDTQIISRRQRFNAVAWMAGNNPCRNQTLFTRDQYGILPKTGVGLQGHQAQLLAIFGLINVPLNYPVYASNQKFTVSDVLRREMRDCKVKSELTFTLIGLAHYTDSDTTWVSGDGEDWSVPRVIQEELGQPIVGAACGGTHRLMGFGHALRRRHAEGKAIDGQWERADQYVKDFVNYTWSLQNRDGSMSTAWYEKPDDNGDIDRKIQTTGHMLELLMTVTPDADLQSPQMLRTVNFMANTLYAERGHEWQIGPKGHALRSLAMYYQRVFGSATPWRPGNGSQSARASAVRTVR